MSSGDCLEIINSIIFQETIVQQVKPSGEDTVGGHDKKVNKGFHFPAKWWIVTTTAFDLGARDKKENLSRLFRTFQQAAAFSRFEIYKAKNVQCSQSDDL